MHDVDDEDINGARALAPKERGQWSGEGGGECTICVGRTPRVKRVHGSRAMGYLAGLRRSTNRCKECASTCAHCRTIPRPFYDVGGWGLGG